MAKAQAALGNSGDIVSRALRTIKRGKIPKGIRHLVGRSVVRAIPLIGTGIAIFEFVDNVEAHGFGGAVARATPVLGDLISAYDVGSELAQQIRDDAAAKASAAEEADREVFRRTWSEADAQTLSAFQELASQIKVTNVPQSSGDALVDPQEIADALSEFRSNMQSANLLRTFNVPGFDFGMAVRRNKHILRVRLEKACQRNAPKAPPVPSDQIF